MNHKTSKTPFGNVLPLLAATVIGFAVAATYLKEFDVPASMLADGRRLELDLGRLRNVADATLNGKPLGILWKPPYVYNVSGLVRSGQNELKIEIVNLWANRLVGDAKLPREKRVTRITQKVPIGGPHESGLLGPVQVHAASTAGDAYLKEIKP